MNIGVEPPPPNEGWAVSPKVAFFIALAILLVVIGIGGSLWSVRHVYLSDKPAPIPEASAPSETTVPPHLVKQAWPRRAKQAPRFANACRTFSMQRSAVDTKTASSRAVGGEAPALANRENGFAPFLLFPIMKLGKTRFDLR